MNNVLILGGGGHASDILGIIESINLNAPDTWRVVGIFDDNADVERFEDRNVEIFPNVESVIDRIDVPNVQFISAIGDPKIRLKVAQSAEALGLKAAPPLIHPGATNISTKVLIGDGSVIHASASVNVKAVVGRHVFVSHGALIGHDSVLEDGAIVMPGASTAGGVHVGRGAMIGSGAIVLENHRIGEFAKIGAGAVVIKDVGAHLTAVGIPAKAK